MNSRLCRKCNEQIPWRIKIGDKFKSLQNRKFCLRCSPFGQHNTSKIDPKERKKKRWESYSQKERDSITKCLYRRGLERKLVLVKMKGGKCQKCGYYGSLRGLSFHHRDRREKLFGLSLNHLWSKSWDKILTEANKCELLCANCHTEIEDKISNKTMNSETNKIKEFNNNELKIFNENLCTQQDLNLQLQS